MMGLDKPKLRAKFEDVSPSRCRYIIGESKILRNFSSPRPRPPFSLGVILWWALANPSCVPNLKSLASAYAEILQGSPSFWEAPLTQGHTHFSSSVISWWALANPSCMPNLKSLASFITKYKGICFKRQIRFLSHPAGEFRVTFGL